MKRFAIRFNAPVVLSFAIISLLVLVLDSATGGASTARLFCVYRAPLTDPLTYVRFFTHVLGHSGYSHYMGNMLLLLLVGPGLEEKYGSRTLLAGILLTAGVSGILQCVFFPGSALLGASGIVFMLIMLASLAGMKDGRIPLTLILAAVLYLGQEVYAWWPCGTTWQLHASGGRRHRHGIRRGAGKKAVKKKEAGILDACLFLVYFRPTITLRRMSTGIMVNASRMAAATRRAGRAHS